MKRNVDYIYVAKADLNEGVATGIITKAALYFTKEYLFVLPFGSLRVLLAGTGSNYFKMEQFVKDLDKQIHDLSIENFQYLLLNQLHAERIYKIAELEEFTIQVGFWIFGGMQIRGKDGPLQSINIQPRALREKIKEFYGI